MHPYIPPRQVTKVAGAALMSEACNDEFWNDMESA